MTQFVQKNFLFFYAAFELILLIYAIDSRSKKVGVVRQKVDVVLPKGTRLSRINFQNSKRAAISANDDVDRALDPVLKQQGGNFEAGLCGDF